MMPEELEMRKSADSDWFFYPRCEKCCTYSTVYKISTYRWKCNRCDLNINANKLKIIEIIFHKNPIYDVVFVNKVRSYQVRILPIRIIRALTKSNEKIKK